MTDPTQAVPISIVVRRTAGVGADLDRIVKLDRDGWSAARWRQVAAADWTLGLLAEVSNRAVGAAFYTLRLHDAGFLVVRRVVVSPQLRRRGIGRRLVLDLKKQAGRHSCRFVVLYVPVADLPTQLWLRACAIRCVGENSDRGVLRFLWDREDERHGYPG